MRLIPVIAVAAVVFTGVVFHLQSISIGPVGIVVPHHDMVAETRATYFKEISNQIDPKTIVILSPDHFNRANEAIITTDKLWETTVGSISPDLELIQRLAITIQTEPFLKDHGVTSLLKDIRRFFPSSRLVPILINRNATFEEVILLTRSLYQECPDCLLVSSVDFSHTTDAMVADLHDVLTMRELDSLDLEALYKEAEVDSPESLVALATWAKLHNQTKFELFSHTNSGFLSNVKSGEMTTHIIGGYYKGKPEPIEDTVTFMAAGDVSLSRGVHSRIKIQPHLLDNIGERFFWGVDISLVNLEGYFSNSFDLSVWEQKPPLLPMSEENSRYLDFLRINTVNLANNHTKDGGDSGLQKTILTIAKHGIDIIGDESNISEASVKIKQFGNVKVAFIGIYTHEPFSNIVETIEQLSNTGHHTVVYAHWGEEYNNLSKLSQKTMAQDWIDAGADLVVGSHPHVVQDFEVYKGRPIVFSLGNFMFDHNFSEEVQTGAVLGGKFEEESLSLFVVPINSYLEPHVLEDKKYENSINNWTKNWSNNLQDSNYFKFDLIQI